MDDEKIIDLILEDLRELKRDVKSLLALKYQIFGIVTTVSVMITIGGNFLLKKWVP